MWRRIHSRQKCGPECRPSCGPIGWAQALGGTDPECPERRGRMDEGNRSFCAGRPRCVVGEERANGPRCCRARGSRGSGNSKGGSTWQSAETMVSGACKEHLTCTAGGDPHGSTCWPAPPSRLSMHRALGPKAFFRKTSRATTATFNEQAQNFTVFAVTGPAPEPSTLARAPLGPSR